MNLILPIDSVTVTEDRAHVREQPLVRLLAQCGRISHPDRFGLTDRGRQTRADGSVQMMVDQKRRYLHEFCGRQGSRCIRRRGDHRMGGPKTAQENNTTGEKTPAIEAIGGGTVVANGLLHVVHHMTGA